MDKSSFMSWIHIGDLHASAEDGWESVDRLRQLVDSIKTTFEPGSVDFVYLPGDNANHGEEEQYARVKGALEGLPFDLHAIAGDHDFEPGNLQAFQALDPRPLPRVERFDGRRALFLDIVSEGSGGPDFRLGPRQTSWLHQQLASARASGEPAPVVFMHAFPADLHEGGDELAQMLADHGVPLVDTGHTHYNELLVDKGVVYTATRSTGQVEEGAFGYSVVALDGATASWRFKEFESGWPWVMVTTPGDARLGRASPGRSIHASVFGPDVRRVFASIDDGPALALRPLGDRPHRWGIDLSAPVPSSAGRLAVTAVDGQGREDTDTILLDAAGESAQRWIAHGVLGTRLGPNANGRHW